LPALDVGFGALLCGQRVIVILQRYRFLFSQWLEPLDILIGLVQLRQGDLQVGLCGFDVRSLLGLRQIRLGLGQLSLGLHELSFILASVEGEEYLSRRNHGAFGVALRPEKRLHTGADFHRLGGVGARR
jgi:hypothetical protein